MRWYLVVKTINGHRYRYKQRTWREGGKVKTHSVYLGRAVGPVLARILEDGHDREEVQFHTWGEPDFIDGLLDDRMPAWMSAEGASVRAVEPADAPDAEVDLDISKLAMPRLLTLPLRLNISVIAVHEARGLRRPMYDVERHRFLLPDVSRYAHRGRQSAEVTLVRDLVHECAHASMRFLGRAGPGRGQGQGMGEDDRGRAFAREEAIAVLATELVLRRCQEARDSRQTREALDALNREWDAQVVDAGVRSDAVACADYLCRQLRGANAKSP